MADETFDNLVVNKNLGIATTEPAAQLHVAATEGISSKVFVESINGGLLQVTAEQDSASIGTENAFPLSINTNGLARIQISSDGNIGMGTQPATDALLAVNGTVKATAFQGDGSRLSGKVSTAGDTMTGSLTIQSNLSVNGNVGIGTANPNYKLEVAGDIKAGSIHSKPKLFAFKVEGDFDNFYPVVFDDDENWGEGPIVLEINRPDVHIDSLWRGALNSKFIFHSTAWGHGADCCRSEIYYSVNPFIAGYQNYFFYRRFVVWLRGGGTSYYWRANPYIALVDYSAKEKTLKINNDDRTTINYPVKNQIDTYVVVNGICFDQNFIVNGKVGIGTSDPKAKLDVAGEVRASNFPTVSDLRLKKGVTQLTNVLEKLEKIRGVSFEWNEMYESLGHSTGHREIGVMAQEVEAVFPEMVTTWGEEGYKAVDYGRLTSVLIEAAKELKAENSALKQRIEVLEKASADSQAKT